MRHVVFGLVTVLILLTIGLSGCDLVSDSEYARLQYQREEKAAAYQSEFAKTVNKLEMSEGNFKAYRRVVFYNVRLGETVFTCEGYSHVRVDSDGDIEIVTKTDDNNYLRHYLKPGPDIIYFSQQLKPTEPGFHHRVCFNPKLWVPEIFTKVQLE